MKKLNQKDKLDFSFIADIFSGMNKKNKKIKKNKSKLAVFGFLSVIVVFFAGIIAILNFVFGVFNVGKNYASVDKDENDE